MRVEWHGQSAFTLSGEETKVFIDPFADMSMLEGRGVHWDYPPIEVEDVDLVLVTHEHLDHNGIEAIKGQPEMLRAIAGTHESQLGEVVGVASEHDEAAGTERGHNVMYVFDFGGLRVAHLGDLGQRELRPEQAAALGTVDLLFVPVGGGPTIGAEQATDVAATLSAKVIVPMHYKTERIDFLDPVDAFADAARRVARLESATFAVEDVASGEGPVVVVPAAP